MTATLSPARTSSPTRPKNDSSGLSDTPRAKPLPLPKESPPVGASAVTTKVVPQPVRATSWLLDPTLALLADVVDDLENTRIVNENRLRQLTRTATDKDGEERGFGLPPNHPNVIVLTAIGAALLAQEKQAVKALEKAMKQHPLGPWVKAQVGVGNKQGARLLSAVNDPYWNDLHGRPRTVSELWAYCGLHVLPASHFKRDAHGTVAGGEAPKRRKGQRANWSTIAKTRAHLIAEQTIKYTGKVEASGRVMPRSPYRDVYENRRAHTAATHPDWTDGHSHNDALRITSKEILKALWVEAKRLHEDSVPGFSPLTLPS